MNVTIGATTPGTETVSRRWLALLSALLLALLLGSQFMASVDAKRVPANGASIAKRVGAQKDLCEVGGGTFESNKTAFGSTITTCTGGDGGSGTCVNTVQSTDCHPPLTRPEEDPYTPPTGGVYDEPVLGGIQTGTVVGSTTGELARAADGDETHGAKTQKDRNKKHKNKKGKAGGKRRG